ncbi:MAG: polysaccharide biosynthesis tyrosine autokinase [Tunicatimonas sp.]
MKDYKDNQEDNIDIAAIVEKAKAHWYYFAISLLVFLTVAYVYNRYTQPNYEVSATILFDNIKAGSTDVDVLMEGENANFRKPENTLSVENEISIIKTDNLIRQVIQQLDYNVTYYKTEKFWPNFIETSWLKEVHDGLPFRVVVDSAANQLINVPIKVEILSASRVRLTANADEAALFNFAKNTTIKRVENIEFDQTITVGEPFASNLLNITLVANETSEDLSGSNVFFEIKSDNSLTRSWNSSLLVEGIEGATEGSRVFNLKVETNVPVKGKAFVDQLIEVYRDRNLGRKDSQGQTSVDFLDDKIAVVADSLTYAEQALQSFKSESNFMDLGAAQSSVYSNLGELDRQKAGIEDQLNYYRSTLGNLKDVDNAGKIVVPSTYGIDNQLLNRLVEQYLEVTSRLRSLRYNASDQNPLVLQLEAQANDLQGAIAQSLNSSVRTLTSQLAAINQRVGKINYNLSELPGNERRLAILERNRDFYDERYKFLTQKRTAAQLAMDSNTPDFEVIEESSVSDNPVWPNTNLIYSLAIALGLALPIGLIFLKDQASDSVTDKHELESRTKAPLIGMIANGPKDAKLVNLQYPNTGITESFKFARVNLQYFHGGDEKVIGVTSSVSGEGKTFCSVNLSASFAESGKKTLLICGDLRQPRILEYINVRSVGLADYFSGDVSLDTILQSTIVTNMDVIAPGKPINDPIRLFESQDMDVLMSELKERYDTIIIETPPIGYVADYFVLLKYIDVNLFVVRYNYTKKNILDGINDLYKKHKIKNLNILFNDVKSSNSSYYGYINESSANGYYSKTPNKGLLSNFKKN